MKIVILAGGQGKRLWPLSTQQEPKQFVHLGDHESLLKKTVRRFVKQDLLPLVYIVTHQQYAARTFAEVEEFDSNFRARIIIEPYSKNTAPAIAWAIKTLLRDHALSPSERIVTIPIDHVFSDEVAFVKQLMHAAVDAHQILAFGVPCMKPVTGYGYIKKGKPLSNESYQVEKFIEKPTQDIAHALVQEGGWLWNIGVYIFSAETYLEALKLHHRILYDLVTSEGDTHLLYKELKGVSIDDAIMVHTEHLRVKMLSCIQWLDIGSWDSLYEFLGKELFWIKSAAEAAHSL